MAPFLHKVLDVQSPRPPIYAEPFAGGAGAALRLLVDEQVQSIVINDLNPGIAAFWRCVFYDTDALVELVETQEISVESWKDAAAVYNNPAHASDLELGFATFFLNRCNRSGILNARPIGGLEQKGPWKINARFNRRSLSERLRLLGRLRARVIVEELDGIDLLQQLESDPDSYFVYLDPPYIDKGQDLYMDALSSNDHAELASTLRQSSLRWILTYDTQAQIIDDLYSGFRCLEFDIAHTAQRQHIGSEYMLFSDSTLIPNIDVLPNAKAAWLFV